MAKKRAMTTAQAGRLGGKANTTAQHAARALNAQKGGRPRARPRCKLCELAGRTCYHRPKNAR